MSFEERRSFEDDDDEDEEIEIDPAPLRNVTLPKLAKSFNQMRDGLIKTDKKVTKALAIAKQLQNDLNFIRRLPRRIFWWVVLTVISAFIGLFVQNVYLHNQTTEQVQQATNTVVTAKAHP